MTINWLIDPNARWVVTGCMLLGLSSGILSSFAMLRKRSLLGDALAHAALPGICIAFMLTGERSIPVFMVGALASGMLGAFFIQMITRYSRIKQDTALGLILSVFFAFGIVLLTQILHSPGGTKSGLDKFLFGQAAAMTGNDVKWMTVCAGFTVLLSAGFYKELKLLCFDPGFADGIGFPSKWLDGFLNILIVMIVITGLQAVGVVLMVAMLITPAAAARFWTHNLGRMVLLSGGIGALSGILGTYISTLAPRLSTGPLIVLSATALFLVSMIFAPQKGLLAKAVRYLSLRKTVARQNLLRTLYEMAEDTGNWKMSFDLTQVAEQRSQSRVILTRNIADLEQDGLVVCVNEKVHLTKSGLKEAYQIVRNHRLWEMFLMHEEQLAADHVDRDADLIEHFLPRETVLELERLLHVHDKTLKLPPSVHPIHS